MKDGCPWKEEDDGWKRKPGTWRNRLKFLDRYEAASGGMTACGLLIHRKKDTL
jgi:hypothetical protein